MAIYKVLVPSFIGGRLITQDDIDKAGKDGFLVEYAGLASDNLQAVSKADKKTADDTARINLLAEAKDKGVTSYTTGTGDSAKVVQIDDKSSVEDIQIALGQFEQKKII